jgi:large subunit ribosomal protein L4
MSTAQQFTVPVRDAEGKEIEKLEVDGSKIDQRLRPRLLKEAVVMYQANRRVGTHETKTRGQVAGSTKKPWRQKGTGRARAGTRKSPLWRGGGIIFGPHPRDYSWSMPKGKRRLALRSALYSKFRDGEVVVVDGLKVEKPSTRYLAKLLKAVGASGRCLIGLEGLDRNLTLSARNLPGVCLSPVADFNALEVLTAKTVVLTRKALEAILAASASRGRPEGASKAAAASTPARSGERSAKSALDAALPDDAGEEVTK